MSKLNNLGTKADTPPNLIIKDISIQNIKLDFNLVILKEISGYVYF